MNQLHRMFASIVHRSIGVIFPAFLLFISCNSAESPVPATQVHWSYEGNQGPEHWGDLSAEFKPCSLGQRQSPIDIVNPSAVTGAAIESHYRPSQTRMVHTGHSIQVNYDPGSYILVDGVRYELLQFHFHVPSEHRVDGKEWDAEVHLVHRGPSGTLAVVGILINSATENPALDAVLNRLPSKQSVEIEGPEEIDASRLLPDEQSTFRYDGSLTTPPCAEGVKWFVMRESISASTAQLEALQADVGHNSRPVQPLNQRLLTVVGTK